MEENNKKYLDVLANIDFNCWRTRNPYYSDEKLHSSTAAMFKIIMKDGKHLPKFKVPDTSHELVAIIEDKIKNFCFDKSDNDDLGDIFDLIQAWGGKMGRQPYVGKGVRCNFSEWAEDYRRGAQAAQDGNNYMAAIETWLKIRGLGLSFATKHLKFWADMPILDTRISLLLTGKNNSIPYGTCIGSLEELKKNAELPKMSDKKVLSEIEKALFSFSQTFFKNGKLEFLDEAHSNKKDYNIACELTNVLGGRILKN